jgi:penicillin-binding protein 1A
MIGGRNYADSQFNRAVQAQRQPGSSFKPILYLAAVESGIGPDQVFDDHPINIAGWSPENFDRKYLGPVTLREAVAESINTVAVQVAQKIGVPKILNVARRLGLTTQLTPNLSIALGTGEVTLIELTSAYAALANGGDGVWAYGIDEIDTPQGERLYKRQGSGPGKVIELSDVATMTSLLSGVVQHGTGTAANIGRPIAGKTGTSGDFRDAWFMGYSADLVGGVWMGNDDFRPMKRVTGGGLPARLWHNVMLRAHQGLPIRPLIGSDYIQPEPALPVAGASSSQPTPGGGQEEKSFWDKLRSILGGKG